MENKTSNSRPILKIGAGKDTYFTKPESCHWSFYEIRSRTHILRVPVGFTLQAV